MSEETTPYKDQAFKNYWYDEQLKRYIIQFMAIFQGMNVSIGKNDFDSQSNLIEVGIRYGGVDRVVDAILADNTQNKPLRLPLFSCKLTNVSKNPSAQKGTGVVNRVPLLKRGGSFPDDITIMRRRVPTPYTLSFELNLYTSNEDQRFQIMEQILSIFDPLVQFQINDNEYDWNKISELFLEDVLFDDNYPSNADRKVLITSFTFTTIAWLSLPFNYKNDFIKRIYLKFSKLNYTDKLSDLDIDSLYPPDDTKDQYTDLIDADRDFPDMSKS